MTEITNEPQLGAAEFAAKKFNYFVALGRRYPELLALHRQAGQLERNPAFGVDERGRPQRWGDPTEHCLVEAAGAEVLGDLIGLNPTDKDRIIRAAFIHDYRKRGEIEEIQGATDPRVVEQSYQKTKNILRAAGVEPDIIELTEAVAHTSLSDFAEVDAEGSIHLKPDIPPVKLAMHYIDDITRRTEIIGLEERIGGLEAVAATRYPWNEEGRSVWGGRTFFQAQLEIGKLVENQLAQLAGLEDPTLLPAAINQGLIERIAQS